TGAIPREDRMNGTQTDRNADVVITRTVRAFNNEVAEREQAERSSRAQTRALTRVLQQLTREQRFAEFPGIVLAAIVDQFEVSGGALWRYDEVTGNFDRKLDYEGGRVVFAHDPEHPFPQVRFNNRNDPDEGRKAAYLRGECVVLTDFDNI